MQTKINRRNSISFVFAKAARMLLAAAFFSVAGSMQAQSKSKPPQPKLASTIETPLVLAAEESVVDKKANEQADQAASKGATGKSRTDQHAPGPDVPYEPLAQIGLPVITVYGAPPSPAIVYVSAAWVGLPPGTDPDGAGPATSIGYDAFATIQGGVDGVASPGTVIVYAGTYPEAVVVNKSLTISGPQAGQNVDTRFAAFTSGANGPKADPAVEAVLTAAATAPANGANDTLHIMADNITFDGFVIDGNNPSLPQGGAVMIGGINTDSQVAIQTEDASGTAFAANNLQVKNNIVQNFAQRGVELINGLNSGTAPATSGNLITGNLVRNFGLAGILLTFNAYADITFNTVVTPDYPTEAGIWVQDFVNTGSPHSTTIANNNVTVGQDNFGGIWINLAYLFAININNNTVNAAAGVTSGDDFTYGIYLASLRPGTTAQLNGNIVGASGGQFDRGIALWNVGTSPTTTTVTGGAVGHSDKGVSVHDNDPNFGLAGANSAADMSGVNISGTAIGVFVDAAGSTGDTVAMQISGNTSISNTTTAISVVGTNASALIHDNAASIHDNTVGIDVNAGSATITGNNLFANATGLRFSNSASASAHFNRILSTTTAIDNPSSLTLDLENNWWGCNAGPGNTGCGAVTGALADFNPWIVLTASATPDTINAFGTSTVGTDMTHNSNGVAPTGTLPDMPVSYSATNGTMNPTSGTVTAGADSSTFTSTSSNSAIATVTVDTQSVSVPITILVPTPTPTPTATATATVTPIATPIETPTPTPTPIETPTPTPAPSPTSTATPTATPAATPTPTPTATATTTATPVATPTPKATPTPTATATSTATATPIATATPTATPVATPIPSPTAASTPSPTPSPIPTSQTVNLSTRMRVQTGDNVGIGGFIITGTAPKHVLLRAIGPSLAQSGIPDVLADPVLELHGPAAFVTITNDNWRDDPGQEALITADGIPPTNDFESAIDATLAPGAYTAIVRGNGNTSGVALAEVYDLNREVDSKLANLSTRAFVSTGEDIVIAGFLLSDETVSDRVVVRGMGPSLAPGSFPASAVLADPTLELRDTNGTLLSANNNWQDSPVQAAELTAAGLAPANNLESAIVATLPPGLYTALLSGANNGTGIGVVEVYDRGVTP